MLSNNLISNTPMRFPTIIASENSPGCVWVCGCVGVLGEPQRGGGGGGGWYGGPATGPWTNSTEDAYTKRITWLSSFPHDLRGNESTTGNARYFINWRNWLSSANIAREWLDSAKYWRPPK